MSRPKKGLAFGVKMCHIGSMDHKNIVKRLQTHKGRWPEIARGGGMSYRTLKKVADGTTKNPTIGTLAKIAACLAVIRPGW